MDRFALRMAENHAALSPFDDKWEHVCLCSQNRCPPPWPSCVTFGNLINTKNEIKQLWDKCQSIISSLSNNDLKALLGLLWQLRTSLALSGQSYSGLWKYILLSSTRKNYATDLRLAAHAALLSEFEAATAADSQVSLLLAACVALPQLPSTEHLLQRCAWVLLYVVSWSGRIDEIDFAENLYLQAFPTVTILNKLTATLSRSRALCFAGRFKDSLALYEELILSCEANKSKVSDMQYLCIMYEARRQVSLCNWNAEHRDIAMRQNRELLDFVQSHVHIDEKLYEKLLEDLREDMCAFQAELGQYDTITSASSTDSVFQLINMHLAQLNSGKHSEAHEMAQEIAKRLGQSSDPYMEVLWLLQRSRAEAISDQLQQSGSSILQAFRLWRVNPETQPRPYMIRHLTTALYRIHSVEADLVEFIDDSIENGIKGAAQAPEHARHALSLADIVALAVSYHRLLLRKLQASNAWTFALETCLDIREKLKATWSAADVAVCCRPLYKCLKLMHHHHSHGRLESSLKEFSSLSHALGVGQYWADRVASVSQKTGPYADVSMSVCLMDRIWAKFNVSAFTDMMLGETNNTKSTLSDKSANLASTFFILNMHILDICFTRILTVLERDCSAATTETQSKKGHFPVTNSYAGLVNTLSDNKLCDPDHHWFAFEHYLEKGALKMAESDKKEMRELKCCLELVNGVYYIKKCAATHSSKFYPFFSELNSKLDAAGKNADKFKDFIAYMIDQQPWNQFRAGSDPSKLWMDKVYTLANECKHLRLTPSRIDRFSQAGGDEGAYEEVDLSISVDYVQVSPQLWEWSLWPFLEHAEGQNVVALCQEGNRFLRGGTEPAKVFLELDRSSRVQSHIPTAFSVGLKEEDLFHAIDMHDAAAEIKLGPHRNGIKEFLKRRVNKFAQPHKMQGDFSFDARKLMHQTHHHVSAMAHSLYAEDSIVPSRRGPCISKSINPILIWAELVKVLRMLRWAQVHDTKDAEIFKSVVDLGIPWIQIFVHKQVSELYQLFPTPKLLENAAEALVRAADCCLESGLKSREWTFRRAWELMQHVAATTQLQLQWKYECPVGMVGVDDDLVSQLLFCTEAVGSMRLSLLKTFLIPEVDSTKHLLLEQGMLLQVFIKLRAIVEQAVVRFICECFGQSNVGSLVTFQLPCGGSKKFFMDSIEKELGPRIIAQDLDKFSAIWEALENTQPYKQPWFERLVMTTNECKHERFRMDIDSVPPSPDAPIREVMLDRVLKYQQRGRLFPFQIANALKVDEKFALLLHAALISAKILARSCEFLTSTSDDTKEKDKVLAKLKNRQQWPKEFRDDKAAADSIVNGLLELVRAKRLITIDLIPCILESIEGIKSLLPVLFAEINKSRSSAASSSSSSSI
jgi:hypothetical protein